MFSKNHGRYGHRRVHRELVKAGWQVAKKTGRKLMRQLGLACQVRRKRKYASYQGQTGKVAPNVLDRDFAAAEPNQKWVTDVTEFRVGDDKVYLSPVMDLFDRQIIAYSISRSPNLQMTNSSLRAALATLDGQHPLVHSDQGFQYQHTSWRRLLHDAGATQSMSRKGNCFDNAVIENFFGHLKEECFHHVRYLSIEALTMALHKYIDWYNNDRISTKLEGLSRCNTGPKPRGLALTKSVQLGKFKAGPLCVWVRRSDACGRGRQPLRRWRSPGLRRPAAK